MALQDFYSNLNFFIRWLHVFSGILWLGLVYFFLFINTPVQKKLSEDTRKDLMKNMIPPALRWVKGSATLTLITGFTVFTLNYMYSPGSGFGPTSLFVTDDGMTSRAVWIQFAMTFAIIMWFVAVFVISPIYGKILAGGSEEDIAALKIKATKFTRMNAFMSGPMLLGMLAPQNYAAVNTVTLLIIFAIGCGLIMVCCRLADL